MGAFVIEGGHSLKGIIEPQGAKNEALQVICAALLTSEPVTLHRVPDILDVNILLELLADLGVAVTKPAPNTVVLHANRINPDYFATEAYTAKSGTLRGTVMLAGPLLAKYGYAYIPQPGGDKIGRRRLDTHIEAFAALGADCRYDPLAQRYTIKSAKLNGKYILLNEPSVTGTANLIMAATLAEGTTTLYNAACEPYIQQLCLMLLKMGAQIEGIGSNLLHITGVNELKGCTHTLLADMIEVGSFIGLAAATQSEITITNADVKHLGIIPGVFEKLGINMHIQGNDIHIPAMPNYAITRFIDGSVLNIYDHPWPGFTPDLISIILVVATQAKGTLLVHQKMFESRLFFVDKLIEMGAQIVLCDPHRAVVIGQNRGQRLRGISMVSPDIRAGVALLIAALTAEGTSTIQNIQQIDRGYERIDQRLNAIGAHITRKA